MLRTNVIHTTSYSACVLIIHTKTFPVFINMGDLNNTRKAVYKAVDVKIVLCMLLC